MKYERRALNNYYPEFLITPIKTDLVIARKEESVKISAENSAHIWKYVITFIRFLVDVVQSWEGKASLALPGVVKWWLEG